MLLSLGVVCFVVMIISYTLSRNNDTVVFKSMEET